MPRAAPRAPGLWLAASISPDNSKKRRRRVVVLSWGLEGRGWLAGGRSRRLTRGCRAGRVPGARPSACSPPIAASSRWRPPGRPPRGPGRRWSAGQRAHRHGRQLSKPTSATSSGMRRPTARSVSATPRAIWSLPQKIASGRSASSSPAASRPQCSLHSPNLISPHGSGRPPRRGRGETRAARSRGEEPLGTGDVRDPPPADRQQVGRGGRRRPRRRAAPRRPRRASGGLGHRVHDRDAGRRRDRRPRLDPAAGHDQPVDPAAQSISRTAARVPGRHACRT